MLIWPWTTCEQIKYVYEFFNSADFGAKTEADTCGQLYDAVYDGDFEKVKEILCWDDKSKEKVKL